jgi:AraC family transcriptional regulator
MRTTTAERHAVRITRAVDLIEGRLEAPPSMQELAGAAGLSSFHFQRLYRAMTGESIAETLRRLRLARALALLASPEVSVTDAALAAGYASSQSFARAFRALDAGPASDVRRDRARLDALVERLRAPPAAAETGALIDVRVVTVDPFTVAALRRTGPWERLDAGYEALFGWAIAHGHAPDERRIYGIPADDPRDAGRASVFDCCLALGDVAADPANGVLTTRLGGGLHARCRHVGPYETLPATWDRLYRDWLTANGFEPADRPLFHHYLDTPDETPPGRLRTDVYLPLART